MTIHQYHGNTNILGRDQRPVRVRKGSVVVGVEFEMERADVRRLAHEVTESFRDTAVRFIVEQDGSLSNSCGAEVVSSPATFLNMLKKDNLHKLLGIIRGYTEAWQAKHDVGLHVNVAAADSREAGNTALIGMALMNQGLGTRVGGRRSCMYSRVQAAGTSLTTDRYSAVAVRSRAVRASAAQPAGNVCPFTGFVYREPQHRPLRTEYRAEFRHFRSHPNKGVTTAQIRYAVLVHLYAQSLDTSLSVVPNGTATYERFTKFLRDTACTGTRRLAVAARSILWFVDNPDKTIWDRYLPKAEARQRNRDYY